MAIATNALVVPTLELYYRLGFVYAPIPIVTGNDCVRANEMFQVTTSIDKKGKRSSVSIKKEINDKKEVDTDDTDNQ